MNYEQLAFVNRQLATMLKDGIPLEGALRQLVESIPRGKMQHELRALEADLVKGVPLQDAIRSRKLPELYVRLVEVGARSGELPGLLILLADYYERVGNIWTRLKGIMVYPLIVLLTGLALSGFFAFVLYPMLELSYADMLGQRVPRAMFGLYMPVFVTLFLLLGFLFMIVYKPLRRWIVWNVSPFKEAGLARLASAFSMLLRGGCRLDEAILLIAQLELKTPAGRILRTWHEKHARGGSSLMDFATPNRIFPRLFLWLVQGDGDRLADGFERAAQVYAMRAQHHTEIFLHAALPAATLILAVMVSMQMWMLFLPMIHVIDQLGQW